MHYTLVSYVRLPRGTNDLCHKQMVSDLEPRSQVHDWLRKHSLLAGVAGHRKHRQAAVGELLRDGAQPRRVRWEVCMAWASVWRSVLCRSVGKRVEQRWCFTASTADFCSSSDQLSNALMRPEVS